MKKLLLALFFALVQTSKAQIVGEWINTGGLNYQDEAFNCISDITTDKNGNVYSVGTIDSFKKQGSLINANFYGINDILIIKYRKDGSISWVKTAGGEYIDYARAITYLNGHIYIVGSIAAEASFDTIHFIGKGNADDHLFIAKLDTNGNYKWVKFIDKNKSITNFKITNPFNYPKNLDIITDGVDLYFTGSILGDYDSISILGHKFKSFPTGILFVTRLDTNGNAKWVKTKIIGMSNYGGTYTEASRIIGMRQTNSFVYASDFPRLDTLNFGPGGSSFYSNFFISKFDNNNKTIWELELGDSANWKCRVYPYAIETDLNNNIYSVGTSYKKFYFDTTIKDTSYSSFIVKINGVNGKVIKAKQLLSKGSLFGNIIVSGCDLIGSNELIISGTFSDTVLFNNIKLYTRKQPMNLDNDYDIFIASIDTNLSFRWATQYIQPGYQRCFNSKYLFPNLYLMGTYTKSIKIDSFSSIADSNNFWKHSFFISKLRNINPDSSVYIYDSIKIPSDSNNTLINNGNIEKVISIFPNPASKIIYFIKTSNEPLTGVSLYDIQGKKINSISLIPTKNQINVSDVAKGIYYLIFESITYRYIEKIELE